MGTPQLAVTVLEELNGHHEVVGVFTRPDAIRGRGKALVASPVKQKALELGLSVHSPKTLKEDDALSLLTSLAPDAICVAAYGCLLPPQVLAIPRYGCLNVHTSLLPRWRGAAPIERAIVEGDAQTGVCIMKMEEGLDTGPYCLRETVQVDELYREELSNALAEKGAAALVAALGLLESGSARWCEQESEGLTYAEKLGKGELDFTPADSVYAICARVRASSDSHPSKIRVANKVVAVERASIVARDEAGQFGNMAAGDAAFRAKRLVICASDGIVELEKVKPDGKKSMDGRAFASGLQGIKNKSVSWGEA